MATYFVPEEWHCKCGRAECDAKKEPVAELASRLNTLRERLGKPIVITSGLRCQWWNDKQTGSVSDSEHVTGEGVDIAVLGSTERWALLGALFKSPLLFSRVGLGSTFIHLGVGKDKAQRVAWTYSK